MTVYVLLRQDKRFKGLLILADRKVAFYSVRLGFPDLSRIIASLYLITQFLCRPWSLALRCNTIRTLNDND